MSTPEVLNVPDHVAPLRKPKVLIAGAGIGGLTLAILLKKAGVDFLVLERANEIKPLGSAMLFGTSVAPLLRQLGIYDDLVNIGKQSNRSHMYDEDLNHVLTMDFTGLAEIGDGCEYIVARPDLYDLLWRNVPRDNIHLGKKIQSYVQNGDSVTIQCSDNTTYQGDILVGADGAYSAVRKQLFNDKRENGTLPASDNEPLLFTRICLVGQTEILDPEEFPNVKDDLCQHSSVLGHGNKRSWLTFTTKKKSVCWIVYHFNDKKFPNDDDTLLNSEWGSESTEAMCSSVRNYKVPGGTDGKILTLGDYIDRTPKNLISKAILEEKVFDTWYDGRVVLLGDACHKMSTSGASGALTAMHDAVALSSWIYTLQSSSASDISAIFYEYHVERHPIAKEVFEASEMFSKLWDKNMMSSIARALMKRMPAFLWARVLSNMASRRPQVCFLPLVDNKGTGAIADQPSLRKTLAILKERIQANNI
ncbi:hypothetical protein MVEG_08224 [Podila verticillata NRRL 6337]|nr:hypothetical protein MVEG_08224 [Podila verticillata NRRL 6337]